MLLNHNRNANRKEGRKEGTIKAFIRALIPMKAIMEGHPRGRFIMFSLFCFLSLSTHPHASGKFKISWSTKYFWVAQFSLRAEGDGGLGDGETT